MARRFVICEINENYLENVKKQMKEQKMPMPKDDSNLTIAHNPVGVIDIENLDCDCKNCKILFKPTKE